MATSLRDAENLLDQFHDQGYVVARQLLDVEQDIKPVIREYELLLDNLVTGWHVDGRLSSNLSDLDFSDKLATAMAQIGGSEVIQHLDITLPGSSLAAGEKSELHDDTPAHFGPAIFQLLTSPRLLDGVEKFIGPEILSNPIQHTRIKPPQRMLSSESVGEGLVAGTQWHQDDGVGLEEAENSDVLTVWLPITESTVQNGCLLVVPESHKEGLALHCPKSPEADYLHIRKQHVLPGEIPLPMSPGDVLFMHKRTMHSSLINNSDTIRWSFDIRYNPIGQPTGRPFFPGFIARSQQQPENVLDSAVDWEHMWNETRIALAGHPTPAFTNWRLDDPRCA